MAKKHSMNFFEAHLEKMALAIGILVCGGVVITQLIRPGKVEVDGRVYKASEAAQKAAEQAAEIEQDMERITANSQSAYPKGLADNFLKIPSLPDSSVDNMPLSPVYALGIQPEEPQRGPYEIPEILALKDPVVDLTHQRALVPAAEQDQPEENVRFASEQFEVEDVDFVTVEARFPWAQMRKEFLQSFSGPGVEALDWCEPIVADVHLQRSQLMPDNTWSEFETVPRLEVDEVAERLYSPQELAQFSQTEYEVLLETRQTPEFQYLVIKPEPYELLDVDRWLPPTEKAEREQQLRKEERTAQRTVAARDSRRTQPPARGHRPSPTGRRPAVPRRPATTSKPPVLPGAMPGMPGMPIMPGMPGMPIMPGMPGMPIMPGMPGAPAMPGIGGPGPQPGGRSIRRPSRRASIARRPGETSAQTADWMESDEVVVWAHDGDVQPGGIYRYRMRIGFFNPIAGHNWCTEEQQQLKNQQILWSAWISPAQVVVVPERTVFFPLAAGSAQDRTVRVEVYHWQDGLWHKERFRVGAGASIGSLVKPKSPTDEEDTRRRGTTDEDAIPVDYRTNIVVLDIVPGRVHWAKTGNWFKEVVTTDIIYRDKDGTVKKLGVDKRCWPERLRKIRTLITKKMKEQEGTT